MVEQATEPKQEEVVPEAMSIIADQRLGLSAKFHTDEPKQEEVTRASAEQDEVQENKEQRVNFSADLKPKTSEQLEGITLILEED